MTNKVLEKHAARAIGQKTYFTGKPCLKGHVGNRSVANGSCVKCNRDHANRKRLENPELDREKSRQWYAKNKEKATAWKREWVSKNREKYIERRKKYRMIPKTRAIEMFHGAKFSAKEKNIPFDLDMEWIKQKIQAGICELTGIKFKLEPLENGRQNPYTASLDRIVPEEGYIKSNVRMILWALNAAFNSYGEDVYANIARVYLEKHPHRGLT